MTDEDRQILTKVKDILCDTTKTRQARINEALLLMGYSQREIDAESARKVGPYLAGAEERGRYWEDR